MFIPSDSVKGGIHFDSPVTHTLVSHKFGMQEDPNVSCRAGCREKILVLLIDNWILF
jgi:hypothetical protein